MKHLLVVAHERGDIERWSRAVGIPSERCYIVAPHSSGHKLRGFNAPDVGIVRLAAPLLSDSQEQVLKMYLSLGAFAFDSTEHDTIRVWLDVDKPDPERRRKTREIVRRNAKNIIEKTCDPHEANVEINPYDDMCEIIRLAGEELKKVPPAAIRDRLCLVIEACIKILRYV